MECPKTFSEAGGWNGCVCVCVCDGMSAFDREFWWMCWGGGWQLWPLPLCPPTCPLSLLTLVPSPPTPLSPHPHQQKDLLDEEVEVVGGTSFMTSLPCPPSPIRFSGPFVPASSSGVGGHHLYRCLGIKAPWPLLLRGGLGQRWLGQGARGRGGLLFVPACRVELQFPQTWEPTGGPRAPAAWQRWGNVYRAKGPHTCSVHAFMGPAFTHRPT